MPKINVNGVTREMTAEEIAELEKLAQDAVPEEIDVRETVRKIVAALKKLGIDLADM